MQSSTRLPMSTFPHLRKICKAGFIVDSNGKNSYLIHPERMEVSTLYISGGRNILVTPETSFLANKYMKLHQPGLRHERVVVEGFGHSDLLIGEESYKKVFPHILSHIRLAEQGENVVMSSGKKCNEEALAWADDPYGEERGFGMSPPTGFSDHPHRGFETVTYMLQGGITRTQGHYSYWGCAMDESRNRQNPL
ncbi:hypothetical protein Ddye_006472 [Dipteronia dyeriana]|uniref:Pirin N-terminal domain-containing protein n=1 Tax=Dipteronia dyeriana TaxID=168575 RepID=A0AAD9XI74_9ROSI|nr:hypothetical protein Ddye_006472 [Dipteronia dyeriana]